MIELYHNNMSTCSQKVRLALAEKGLDWEEHHLNLRAGDQQAPAYMKLNPRGVVPTLVHDGRAIPESNVILEYLDEVFPEPPLRPATPFGRARMRLWTKRLDEGHHDIATATISSAVAFRHQYLARGEAAYEAILARIPDAARRERRRDVIVNGIEAKDFRTAIAMWVRLLTDMETALSGTPWLAGESYSLADAAFTPYLTRLDHLHALGFLDGRPHLADWYDRVRARPSYKPAITDWLDPSYMPLMAEKGDEAWPRIAELIAETSKAA